MTYLPCPSPANAGVQSHKRDGLELWAPASAGEGL
jgi:hypothetical protein